jgi:hypothetical protein
MQLLFGALAAAAALLAADGMHPDRRLLDDSMRSLVDWSRLLGDQSMVIRMGRELQTEEDVNKAVAKCILAVMPPSVAQTFTCLGIDLSNTATVQGQVSKFEADVQKDMAQLESIFAGNEDPFKSGGKINVTKGQCESLYATKTLQCNQIMLASDPFDYVAKNPFPTSIDKLPAGCSDIVKMLGGDAAAKAQIEPVLTGSAPQVTTGCQQSKTDCAATGPFSDVKALFVSIFNQCSALGVNPTSQLPAQDAANAKAAMGVTNSPSNGPTTQPSSAPPTNVPSSAPPTNVPSSAPSTNVPSSAPLTNAAGLVASVVAAAVVVAL